MQAHVEHDEVVELIRLDPRQEEHEAIRELWKSHSIAEDNRDLPGLLATLTDDCVYTVRPGDHRWEGHEGAARFYGELLTAFPDIHFDLTGIVIGPQGVVEEARVGGTHQAKWLDYEPTGEFLEWNVAISSPGPERRLFGARRSHGRRGLHALSQRAIRSPSTSPRSSCRKWPPPSTVSAGSAPGISSAKRSPTRGEKTGSESPNITSAGPARCEALAHLEHLGRGRMVVGVRHELREHEHARLRLRCRERRVVGGHHLVRQLRRAA